MNQAIESAISVRYLMYRTTRISEASLVQQNQMTGIFFVHQDPVNKNKSETNFIYNIASVYLYKKF